MPTLSEASNVDLSGYSPIQAGTAAVPQRYTPPASQTNDMQPGYNSAIRCPLPPIFQATPDSLRQFYSSSVPQTRLLSAVTSGINGGGGGGNAVVSSVITQSSGSNPAPVQLAAKQVSVTTTPLGPGATFTGAFAVTTESFQLLSLTASTQARVEIYGTAFSQTADLSRAIDVPPPAGSTQNIITDVAMDTVPYAWNFQNRIGANGDNPQKPMAYVTVTNLSGAVAAITVTLQYVPLETS